MGVELTQMGYRWIGGRAGYRSAGVASRERRRVAAVSLTCSAAAPSEARQWVVGVLAGMLPSAEGAADLIGDVVLCVSELVTNAVQAGCGQVTLRVERAHDELELALCDDATGVPVVAPAAIDSPRGRGLAIISALAEEWGVREVTPGKEVWVRLAAAR
jgi:anti-sigma regulatory factor (Ser/Thr protein kinase)